MGDADCPFYAPIIDKSFWVEARVSAHPRFTRSNGRIYVLRQLDWAKPYYPHTARRSTRKSINTRTLAGRFCLLG